MSERRLGIVGHAADKFTPETEAAAKRIIREEARAFGATHIVSGRCPLGGVDIWAEEAATDLGLIPIIYPPKVNSWSAPGGYKARNLLIARDSDCVLVIVVAALPEGYKGMRFNGCYHCGKRNPPHVKSGGCWTAWKAKERKWRIIGE